MAWTYSNWTSQATAALQLTRLNLHITEVSDQVGLEISADGKSRASQALQQYLEMLLDRRKDLEKRVGKASAGQVIRVKMVDPEE